MLLRQRELTVGGARFRMTLRTADELPAFENISTAHCLGFARDGRFLLTKHVSRGWTIPGGHLELGETPEEAMRRETREEAAAVVGDAVLLATEQVELLEGEQDPRYPNPAFQAFFLGLIEGLAEFVPNDECTESALFPVPVARRMPGWVDHNEDLFDLALEHAGRQWSLRPAGRER